jgi:hypothetical protein
VGVGSGGIECVRLKEIKVRNELTERLVGARFPVSGSKADRLWMRRLESSVGSIVEK